MEKIKGVLKASFIYKIYRFVRWKIIYLLSKQNPQRTPRYLYKVGTGRILDLENPKAFTEKLQWLKINRYWDNDAVIQCADKFAVRDYVIEHDCGDILTKLYGCWDSSEDIDWDNLPNRFVLKCNHGSGYNIICTDKKTFDIKKAKKTLDKWMKEEYGVVFCEQGIYRKIKRKIIAEEFIETKDGLPPHDYKFFCSQGKVKALFVAQDRVGDNTKFDFYYPDWTYIPIKNYFENHGEEEKPQALNKMIEYAERLSKRFPIVRCDLYNEGEKIYFGELTFLHFGGLQGFEPDEFDFTFGEMFPNIDELRKWK